MLTILHKIPKLGSISFDDKTKKPVPYEWGYGSTPRTAEIRTLKVDIFD